MIANDFGLIELRISLVGIFLVMSGVTPSCGGYHEAAKGETVEISKDDAPAPGEAHSNLGESSQPQPQPSVQSGLVANSKEELEVKTLNDPLESAAERLGLRILSENPKGKSPNLPRESADLSLKTKLDNYTAVGNELIIHTKLYLVDSISKNPERKLEYFFVWPEKVLGIPITLANYSHRIKNSQGKCIGNLESKMAWHDVEGHRWFIPLADIFRGRLNYDPDDVNLEDTQVMSLTLILENGRHVVLNINFQVSGPLPAFRIEKMELDQPVGFEELIRATSTSGRIVQSEKIVNPSNRPFHVWVRHKNDTGHFSLVTYLGRDSYMNQPSSPPLGPFQELYESKGNLELSEVQVVHQDGKVESSAVRPWQWVLIEFKPREEVRVNWLAKPADSVSRCSLPQSENVTFHWAKTIIVPGEWVPEVRGPGTWVPPVEEPEQRIPEVRGPDQVVPEGLGPRRYGPGRWIEGHWDNPRPSTPTKTGIKIHDMTQEVVFTTQLLQWETGGKGNWTARRWRQGNELPRERIPGYTIPGPLISEARTVPGRVTPGYTIPGEVVTPGHQESREVSESQIEAKILNWAFVGAALKGVVEREIRVTHPFTSREDATLSVSALEGPPNYVELGWEKAEVNLSQGKTEGDLKKLNCQGLFP